LILIDEATNSDRVLGDDLDSTAMIDVEDDFVLTTSSVKAKSREIASA
jgi:hypothetical protein